MIRGAVTNLVYKPDTIIQIRNNKKKTLTRSTSVYLKKTTTEEAKLIENGDDCDSPLEKKMKSAPEK